MVKFLADLEIISIDLRTKKGETACDIAKRNGHQNVVDFLNSWRISPNRLPHETRHSIYIRTVSSYRLLSNLLNWFKLVHGLFGQSNMHRTLDYYPDQTSQEGIECTKAK